jgi:hypothetical protein
MNRFELGTCFITPEAKQELVEGEYPPECLFIRHRQGDWGDVDDEGIVANNRALVFGGRVFSTYTIEGSKFLVITLADRSSTTIMLSSEVNGS